MHNEKNIDDLDVKALDIIDAGEDISDIQLDQIKCDAELRKRCQELLDIRTGCLKYKEAQLKDVHISQKSGLAKIGHRRKHAIIISVITVAAIIIGCIFLLTTRKEIKSDQVFIADNADKDIIITKENGNNILSKQILSRHSSISMSDYLRSKQDNSVVEKLIVEVPYGKSTDITLPDGSVVCLHPGSRLKFPTSFLNGKRIVLLEGEAYFKIKKDASHPFVVMTNEIQTTVLGTEFDIKGNVVTLVTGSLRVDGLKNKETRTIVPGEQLSVNDGKFAVCNVDTQPYIYWRDGFLYYDGVDLCDIMKSIGENYNMTVEFKDNQPIHFKMRFIAERDGGIDQTLNLMNRMKKVYVYKSAKKIIIEKLPQ